MDEKEVPRGTLTPVGSLLGGWTAKTCGSCGGAFYTSKAFADETAICRECKHGGEDRARIDAEFGRMTANIGPWLDKWCERAGMTQRERTATIAAMPAFIKNLMVNTNVRADELLGGRIPQMGFGLSGTAGTGKSFMLAALMKECVRARWYRDGQREGLKATKLWLRWVSWPERVNTWRVRSAREHGLAEVHNEMVAMCAVDALVLDDIGAERIKGEYADDWVSSLLDQIIDRRYNALKPTWWTTNLSHEDFTRRYGARMSSRLMSMSPLIRVGAQPDQRPQW